jgi:hypothetical protein
MLLLLEEQILNHDVFAVPTEVLGRERVFRKLLLVETYLLGIGPFVHTLIVHAEIPETLNMPACKIKLSCTLLSPTLDLQRRTAHRHRLLFFLLLFLLLSFFVLALTLKGWLGR